MNQPQRYEDTTEGILVAVTPHYLEDESNPDMSQYFWAYEVVIVNNSTQTVQLRDRHWQITDGSGKLETVDGPGVVGEQPILNPGDEFRYTSGCPLTTTSGFMVGHYTMMGEGGVEIDVAIPAFSLDLPHARFSVN